MVYESKRKENKLTVFDKSFDLFFYTLDITKNKKIFTEEYKEYLTDDIVNTIKNIYLNIWEANNIVVGDDEENWRERNKLQLKAARDCNRALALIGIAKRCFHLRTRRVVYWVGKIINLRALIRAWNKNDKKRYDNLLTKVN